MDISGTTAISGAVDGMLVLKKDSRGSSNSVLAVTGRDVEYSELKLRFEGCRWHFIEQSSADEIVERPVPDCVIEVARFVERRGMEWQGRSTDLIDEVGIDVAPGVLGKYLAQFSGFLEDRGIRYTCLPRSGSTRQMLLQPAGTSDGMTADDGAIPL